MKRYYTLIEESDTKTLMRFLHKQRIKMHVGADRRQELADRGYSYDREQQDPHSIVRYYVALLDESDITALMLLSNDIQIIENRWPQRLSNTLREWYSRFLTE